MPVKSKLSGALQENVLTLLCFDTACAKIIRNTVEFNLFESSIYQDIASHAIDFLDQYNHAVGEHLPDVLEGVLKGPERSKSRVYERTLENLFLAKDEIHSKYIMDQLDGFIRQQSLKGGLVEAVKHVKEGEIDEAENILHQVMSKRISTFDPGSIAVASNKDIFKFLDTVDLSIPVGIPALDRAGVGPAKKEMLLFIAPPKKGKSWWMSHVAKHSLIHRQKVLHISLEMSEERVLQRYMQSFYSISKKDASVEYPIFETDNMGVMTSIDFSEVTRPSFQNKEEIKAYLSNKLSKSKIFSSPRLIVKEFPTAALTVPALKAYLDSLENLHKFVPDVLVLDYPDLMKVDSSNLRVSTGSIFRDIRGIGVEREIAMVVATQGNRSSAESKVVSDIHVAEDYSKIATADNVITYSQTPKEKRLGLARLFVSNGRNDEDKFTVLISQSYAIGQFCLDSARINDNYFSEVEDLLSDVEGDEGD